MVWGGLFGRILGIIIQKTNLNFNVTPGMYALLGMRVSSNIIGAFSALGGITRLTLSLAIIMFELTGTLNYIIPCMICLTVSKLVGDLFGKEGYIEKKIIEKGYPFLDHTKELIVSLYAKDVMTPLLNVVHLPEKGLKVKGLEDILLQTSFQGYPVISSIVQPNIIGYITRSDIEYALDTIKKDFGIDPNALVFFKELESDAASSGGSLDLLKEVPDSVVSEYVSPSEFTPSRVINLSGIMDHTPLACDPNLPVDTVIDMFTKLGLRFILVKVNGKLKGIITKKDILKEINT
jgi:chloride channel 3/4/5